MKLSKMYFIPTVLHIISSSHHLIISSSHHLIISSSHHLIILVVFQDAPH